MSLPCVPVHTVSTRRVIAMMIETVQVGMVTVFVPPGSLEFRGAVVGLDVIVSIFGGKGHATMIRK